MKLLLIDYLKFLYWGGGGINLCHLDHFGLL